MSYLYMHFLYTYFRHILYLKNVLQFVCVCVRACVCVCERERGGGEIRKIVNPSFTFIVKIHIGKNKSILMFTCTDLRFQWCLTFSFPWLEISPGRLPRFYGRISDFDIMQGQYVYFLIYITHIYLRFFLLIINELTMYN